MKKPYKKCKYRWHFNVENASTAGIILTECKYHWHYFFTTLRVAIVSAILNNIKKYKKKNILKRFSLKKLSFYLTSISLFKYNFQREYNMTFRDQVATLVHKSKKKDFPLETLRSWVHPLLNEVFRVYECEYRIKISHTSHKSVKDALRVICCVRRAYPITIKEWFDLHKDWIAESIAKGHRHKVTLSLFASDKAERVYQDKLDTGWRPYKRDKCRRRNVTKVKEGGGLWERKQFLAEQLNQL